MTALVAAEGVVKRFGDRDVLRGLSLSLHAGERVALLGPSGCGKTTFLQILGLLDRPTRGRVLAFGEDVGASSDASRATLRLARIGYVFQNAQLLEHLSVRDNVALPAWRLGGSRTEALSLADRLLDRLGLASRSRARSSVLSAGEAQRVALARALVNRPAIVLADEPTGNLDSASAREVLDVLYGATQDETASSALVVVTHDPAVAARADRALYMEDGVLVDAPAEGRTLSPV